MSPTGQEGPNDFSNCSGFAQSLAARRSSAFGTQNRVYQAGKASVEIRPAQAIDHSRSFLAALDQSCGPEHIEMVRHRGARKLIWRRAVAGKAVAHAFKIVIQAPDNGQTRRVRQGMEHARQWDVVQIWMNEPSHIADIE
jgi:hypothetical protein